MKKIGAEVILTVMLIPFFVWITTTIFSLQSASGIEREKIDTVKDMLQKQDAKLDKSIDVLINKE